MSADAGENEQVEPVRHGRPPLSEPRSERMTVMVTERERDLIDWVAGPGGRSGWLYEQISPALQRVAKQALEYEPEHPPQDEEHEP